MPRGRPADVGGGRLAERGYRSHRAALRCSNAYPVMTMATMITMPRASRSATLTLLSPTSLDNAILICCGTM